MRKALKQICCGLVILWLYGCAAFPGTVPVAIDSPEALRVHAALAQWPGVERAAAVTRRAFFATLRAGAKGRGLRITASGLLEYHTPRDFRLTAVTEIGALLFDGRMNWAGAAVLRQMPELDTGMVETLLQDMAVVFDAPADLTGLRAGNGIVVLDTTGGDAHRHSWIFDPLTGRPRTVEVNLGTTMRADFLQYDDRGWPTEIHLAGRSYDLTISFTDEPVVRGP